MAKLMALRRADDAVGGVPIAAVEFMRADVERADQNVSWERPDERFFAAGACHVLAFRSVEHHPGYRAMLVQPGGGLPGSHVFTTDGVWAFDFNGWTREADLVAANRTVCEERWQGWSCELVDVTAEGLEAFCTSRAHRPPTEFAGDVIARADRFIERFDATPRGMVKWVEDEGSQDLASGGVDNADVEVVEEARSIRWRGTTAAHG